MQNDDKTTTAPPGCAPTNGSEVAARIAVIRPRREAAMQMNGPTWTKDEILDGIWDMYLELCELQTRRDRVNSTRFPDFEQALGQLERVGMPPNDRTERQPPTATVADTQKP